MIKLEGVAVAYASGARAIEAINLTFVAGDFTVLLGPSGAGKSTLLRVCNGLVAPTAGRVIVDSVGEILSARRLRLHRRRTAMVFQQHHLIGRLSALDNVMTGRLGFHSSFRTLLPFTQYEKRLGLDALDRVGLLDLANRRADQLSGGQQQRVGIARALVQRPAVILADEPVASLDPETSRQVLGLLHSICKSDGITAVVSLHQVDLAQKYSDRIVGLSGGRVVLDGNPGATTSVALQRLYAVQATGRDEKAKAIIEPETNDEPQTAVA